MQNKTYSDLYSLVVALSGNYSFTTLEQTKILALVNRRLYQAYMASAVWPRYLVASQARPVTDNVIAREYDEAAGVRTVSTATRDGTTVTVVTTAAIDFAAGMFVTIAGLSGSTSPNGTYQVGSVTDDTTFTYTLDSGTGTETYSGSGTVSPVAVPDIGDFNRIWWGDPFAVGMSRELEFYVDSDGAHIINNTMGLTGAFVGFKKQWGGPYLSTATDIPLEFFYYAAHTAYADYLRMDGQTDKAQVEEANGQQYLVVEIDKAESQRNNTYTRRRFSTYTLNQLR